MASARKLYEDFRGRTESRTLRVGVCFGREWITARGAVNLIIPAELAVVGHVAAIEYDTNRDHRAVLARHEFAGGSRPLLATGTGRNELFLIGGRYRFTDRGIMDIDTHGRLIDDGGLGKR